jgi:hypothetical protein
MWLEGAAAARRPSVIVGVQHQDCFEPALRHASSDFDLAPSKAGYSLKIGRQR